MVVIGLDLTGHRAKSSELIAAVAEGSVFTVRGVLGWKIKAGAPEEDLLLNLQSMIVKSFIDSSFS